MTNTVFEDDQVGRFLADQPSLSLDDFTNIAAMDQEGRWGISLNIPDGDDIACVLQKIVDADQKTRLTVNPLDNEALSTMDFVLMSSIVAKNEEMIGFFIDHFERHDATGSFAP